MEESTVAFTTDERIFSALSHAAIVLPYIGLLAPLLIWTTQREKSAWLRFQALQALAYQILQFVFLMLGFCLVYPLFMVLPFFGMDNPESMFIPIMLLPFLPYLFWGFLILLGLVGGMLCAFGKDFQYPILGRKLREYLGNQSAAPGGNHD